MQNTNTTNTNPKAITQLQAEEIRSLKQELQALRQERNAYRTFYNTVVNRFSGFRKSENFLCDFLDEFCEKRWGAPSVGQTLWPSPASSPLRERLSPPFSGSSERVKAKDH